MLQIILMNPFILYELKEILIVSKQAFAQI
jgi:hypothetical protein